MELENFSYIKSKQTGEWTEETTHEWSHAIDALRYSYSDIYTNKKMKTLNKTILGLQGENMSGELMRDISEVCRDIYEHTKGYHFYYMEVE